MLTPIRCIGSSIQRARGCKEDISLSATGKWTAPSSAATIKSLSLTMLSLLFVGMSLMASRFSFEQQFDVR